MTEIDPTRHLQRAREGLVERRVLLDRERADVSEAIESIDKILKQLYRRPPTVPRIVDAGADVAPVPTGATAREAIIKLLESEDRPFKTSEIVRRVDEFGANAQSDTIRSLISKMRADGQVDAVERGLYRLPRDHRKPSETVRTWDVPEAVESLVAPDGQLRINAMTRALPPGETKESD